MARVRVLAGMAVVVLLGGCAGTPWGQPSVRDASRVPYPARSATVALPGSSSAASGGTAGAGTTGGTAGVSGRTAAAGAAGAGVTLVAAGDIACDPSSSHFNDGKGSGKDCHELATAQVAASLRPDVVAVLGDDQYEDGTYEAFMRSYDPSWGRLKSITRPAVGNHEYGSPQASGYFAYFGAAAGAAGKGWYSYDIGAWHVVVLNSNCGEVGGCDTGSEQLTWLTADLAADRAAHPQGCLLAYWHHPLWSHGQYRGITEVRPFVQALYDARADVILNGHDHNYERYVPRAPNGAANPAHGVREFVVGSGGKSHYSVSGEPGIEAGNDTSYGVLQLTLRPGGYDWAFRAADGGTFHDSGTAACHTSG